MTRAIDHDVYRESSHLSPCLLWFKWNSKKILAVTLHLSEQFLLQLASALTVNVPAVCKVLVNYYHT